MKRFLQFYLLICINACTSNNKLDPRIAMIRQSHQQLLQYQKLAVSRGDDSILIMPLIKKSLAIQIAIDQLDPQNARDPSQVALITNLAREEDDLLFAATTVLRITKTIDIN